MIQASSLTPVSRMSREELKNLFNLTAAPESAKEIDPRNLPEESLEEFSYEGLEFSEAASQLWYHLTIMHYHAASYNRHSQWFPIACAVLEKDIRLAGSFCLTKTVLETQGQEFPSLKNMNIERLYGLISYYFRKCGKAFEDLYHTAGVISMEMHKWELRWLELGERLKATAEKCRRIIDGKINAETLLNRVSLYNAARNAEKEKAAGAKKKMLMERALPILGCYASQVIRERNGEAKTAYYERKWEKSKRMYEQMDAETAKEAAAKAASAKASAPKEKSAENRSPEANGTTEDLSVSEIRSLLIEKAKQRGENAEILTIIGEPPEKIRERFRRCREEEQQKPRPRPGPAQKSRKKKRK